MSSDIALFNIIGTNLNNEVFDIKENKKVYVVCAIQLPVETVTRNKLSDLPAPSPFALHWFKINTEDRTVFCVKCRKCFLADEYEAHFCERGSNDDR